VFDKKGSLLTNIEYYENGKLKTKTNYNEGKIDGWTLIGDEFGNRYKYYFEDFSENYNTINWLNLSLGECSTNFIKYEGTEFKTDNGGFILKVAQIPIKYTKVSREHIDPVDLRIEDDFSITASIQFTGGDSTGFHGIYFRYQNQFNHYYYIVNGKGGCKIGLLNNGTEAILFSSNYSEYIKELENLMIMNFEDKYLFYVNGELIFEDYFPKTIKDEMIEEMKTTNKKSEPAVVEVLSDFKLGIFSESTFSKRILVKNIEIETGYVLKNDKFWNGNGTGFFIDPNGYIITNHHVVNNADKIEVSFIRQGKKYSYEALSLKEDLKSDLALLKIVDNKFKPFTALPYSISYKLRELAAEVFTLGFPEALNHGGEEVKFTDGKISCLSGYDGSAAQYQISTPVQPGNSGGPLFDNDGTLIGIIQSKWENADNVSYAIKSSYLKNLIENYIKLSNDNGINDLKNKKLQEKAKTLSDYIVLIKTL